VGDSLESFGYALHKKGGILFLLSQNADVTVKRASVLAGCCRSNRMPAATGSWSVKAQVEGSRIRKKFGMLGSGLKSGDSSYGRILIFIPDKPARLRLADQGPSERRWMPGIAHSVAQSAWMLAEMAGIEAVSRYSTQRWINTIPCRVIKAAFSMEGARLHIPQTLASGDCLD
jgi:hypothetical protein